jgi:hypothetical protein
LIGVIITGAKMEECILSKNELRSSIRELKLHSKVRLFAEYVLDTITGEQTPTSFGEAIDAAILYLSNYPDTNRRKISDSLKCQKPGGIYSSLSLTFRDSLYPKFPDFVDGMEAYYLSREAAKIAAAVPLEA